jgi:hypothetical protein
MKQTFLLFALILIPMAALADNPHITSGIMISQRRCPKNSTTFNPDLCRDTVLFQDNVLVKLALTPGSNPAVVVKDWTGAWQKQVSYLGNTLSVSLQFSGQTLNQSEIFNGKVTAQLFINGSTYPISQIQSAFGMFPVTLLGPAQDVGNEILFPVLQVGPPIPAGGVSGGNG